MTRVEALENYTRAQKAAQKDYRERMAAGRYPYLPVLDDLLQNAKVESQIPIGTIEAPLELVVGTKTAGRTAAFSAGFLPLLPPDTEFAAKWINLCQAHVEEGIRDPIRCYEYLGRFYVQEGNKRVSVLKFFEADTVAATVTRIMPQYSDNPQIRQYYEFVDYYPICHLYTLTFTQEGSYARLQKAMGKAPGEVWTDEERADVLSLYNWIKKAYLAHGGGRMRTTVGDVILLLMRLYPLKELSERTPAQLAKDIDGIWDDILAIENPQPVKLSTQPAEPAPQGKKPLLERILPGLAGTPPTHLRAAFIHERDPQTSTWTYQHEFGRTQLDKVFPGQVETVAYFGAEQPGRADALLEQAVEEGADIVFTTSPKLVGATLRAALRHPQVRFLNCSVDMPYASIRTYYTRVYEAKFITGAIAGAMTRGETVGYVADSPIFGTPANINAFALGVRMTNPRARVLLEWSCLPGVPVQALAEKGVTVVSGRDTPAPGFPQKEFGTFEIRRGGVLFDLASPFWHWGQFYENVLRTVLNGGWARDKSGVDGRAVNYWWGMNSGVMDVLLSRELPHDVRHLAGILRGGVMSGAIDPFACHIVAQDGTLMNEGAKGFAPEQILHMDWLCDAVEGHIPEYDELIEEARPMYRMQGIHRDRLPAEKGPDL